MSNADIAFDDSLVAVQGLREGSVYALLKWAAQDDSISLSFRSDSQDAWIFKAPMKARVAERSDFMLGAPRCDNRLAQILHDEGYVVENPAFLIHAIEIQRAAREGSLYTTRGAVQGRGRNVLITNKVFKSMD